MGTTTTTTRRQNSCACRKAGGPTLLPLLVFVLLGIVFTPSCCLLVAVECFTTVVPTTSTTTRTTARKFSLAQQPEHSSLTAAQQERRRRRQSPSSSLRQKKQTSPAAAARHTTRLSAAAASSSDSSSSNSSYDTSTAQFDQACDVLVLGSGPAGRAVASLLHAGGLDVVLSDQNLDRAFPPNYGVWHDEWEAVLERYGGAAGGVQLQGGHCGRAIDRMWPVTDCYFGGSFDIPTEERLRVDRPYWRVDRHALRASLTNGYRLLRANHGSTGLDAPNVYAPVNSLVHDGAGSTIRLQKTDGTTIAVRTKLIVDCTGHETKLVLREARDNSPPPGFQIAYGCLVDCEGDGVTATHIGPYDKEAMTLFDYRTDHYDDCDDEAARTKLAKDPTFMYAMPLRDNQIFFEETSLVARPAISFQECKERCLQRLSHHGIRVKAVHEEEFCYIPMGGALPARDQRVLAVGGAAAMVHPSTGFHLCRCMMGASDVAAVVLRELSTDSSSSKQQQQPPNLDRIAAAAYHALWSPGNVRQRNFAVFGGDYLMKQDVVGLRGFFDGFFRLPMPLWGGFLAGWPGLPDNDKHETWGARLWFGLQFVARLPLPVALNMLGSIVAYMAFTDLALAQSVTPFLGEPKSYEYRRNRDNLGDAAAKNEARKMILESKVVVDLPVDFEVEGGEQDAAPVQASSLKPEAPPTEMAIAETPVAGAEVPNDFQ